MSRRKLYRSRDGIVWGVCQGLADWLDIDAIPVRLGFIILALITGFFPLLIGYGIAALILPVEPVSRMHFSSSSDHEKEWDYKYYHRY